MTAAQSVELIADELRETSIESLKLRTDVALADYYPA